MKSLNIVSIKIFILSTYISKPCILALACYMVLDSVIAFASFLKNKKYFD